MSTTERPHHQRQSTTNKQCPYCAEDVKHGAKKCKHCGEYLDDNLRQQHQSQVTIAHRPSHNPGVGAVLSLIIPGAGQMYRGKVGAGFFWLIVIPLSYLLFFPVGLILHILCICDAYKDIRAF